MQPAALIHMLEADIARTERQLERQRTALQSLEACYEWEQSERRAPSRRGGKRSGRRVVKRRKGRLTRKPVRTANGRRTPLAPGSLGDRIVEVLTAFGAPMRKRRLVEQVKAPVDAVVAELRRLRAADRVTRVGKTSGVRYAVPKFAEVE